MRGKNSIPTCIRHPLPNGKSALVTTRAIPPMTELTISYLTKDTLPPTQARQLRLKHFEFTCACPLCQNDTDEETRRIEAHLHNPLKAGIKLTELEEIYTLMESLGIAAGKHKVASRGVVLAERNQDSASAKIWLKRRSADARVEDREVIVERAAKLGLLEGTQLTFEAPPDCELGHP